MFECAADVLPDARLQELFLQQLALNDAGYFVHFHGICRAEDSIMLVYDYIEVSFVVLHTSHFAAHLTIRLADHCFPVFIQQSCRQLDTVI